MGIVGPITSALIGGICLTLVRTLSWTLTATSEALLTAMLVWLGYVFIAVCR